MMSLTYKEKPIKQKRTSFWQILLDINKRDVKLVKKVKKK
jgi:hypothetical protein